MILIIKNTYNSLCKLIIKSLHTVYVIQWGSVTQYKLLCFITTKIFFGKEKNTLAFNRDRCCHLVLCLQLIPFHSTSNGFVLVINIHANKKVKIWSKIWSFFHRNIRFFCSRTVQEPLSVWFPVPGPFNSEVPRQTKNVSLLPMVDYVENKQEQCCS